MQTFLSSRTFTDFIEGCLITNSPGKIVLPPSWEHSIGTLNGNNNQDDMKTPTSVPNKHMPGNSNAKAPPLAARILEASPFPGMATKVGAKL